MKASLIILKSGMWSMGIVPQKKRSDGRQKTALSIEDIRCVT